MSAQRLPVNGNELLPALRILFVFKKCLRTRGNVGQRIIDLVAQPVGEVIQSLQFGRFDGRGKIRRGSE